MWEAGHRPPNSPTPSSAASEDWLPGVAATGSAPLIPPIPGLDEAGYLTSTTAMELTELPESMAVIGGNAVGVELGQGGLLAAQA